MNENDMPVYIVLSVREIETLLARAKRKSEDVYGQVRPESTVSVLTTVVMDQHIVAGARQVRTPFTSVE